MRKAPNRQIGEVTQSYNDGILTVYAVSDTAAAGRMPKKTLTEKVSLRYAEQRLGLSRYYSAKQNQTEAERVVRVPRAETVTNRDIARTEDGTYYGIEMVQSVENVYPPSLDITLSRTEQGAADNVV